MSEFSEYAYAADDLDSPKSCSCRHCTSEGRYDQTSDCIWYRRPAVNDLPVINYATRTIPTTSGRHRATR